MFKHRKKNFGSYKREKRSLTNFLIGSFFVLILGLGLIGILYVFIYSDLLTVKQWTVSGANFIDPNLIKSNIISDMVFQNRWRAWAGPSNFVFWWWGKPAEISKYYPRVKKAVVSTDFWKREVSIRVIERNVFGAWCLPESQCFGFDEDGIVFMRSPETAGFLILKIEDQNVRAPKLLKPVFSKPEWINHIISVVSDLKERELYSKLIIVKDDSLEEWELETDKGTSFIFSFQFKPENLGAVLEKLMASGEFDRMTTIDFRVPDKIFYRTI